MLSSLTPLGIWTQQLAERNGFVLPGLWSSMIHTFPLSGLQMPGRNMSGSLRNDSTGLFALSHCECPFVCGSDSVRATVCGLSAVCNCSVCRYHKTKKRRHAAAATGFPGSPKNAVSRPLQGSIENRIGCPDFTAALWKTVRLQCGLPDRE